MASTRRVVVTGCGVVSPIGLDVPSFWAALLAGRTGTRRLRVPWLDEAEFRTLVGAPLQGFDLTARGFAAKDLKTLDPSCWYALAATQEALASAGVELRRADERETCFLAEGLDPERVATVIGSGVGGLTTFETVHRQWVEHATFKGKAWMRYGLPMLIPNAPTANVAIRFGFHGECKSLPTACAAGTMSVGDAYRLVRDGEADVAVAGGADGVLTDLDGLGMIGFDVLRVMSARNDDGEHASRPFDRDRDGFVLGEGAGVVVLEAEAHARARGARPLAEVLSYASTSDAHSMMQPAPDGRMVVRAMRLALERAVLTPRQVQHVNAHGTGTPAGDRVEAAALREVFGDGSDAPWVSATKSMTGHCIGASGALEIVATVKALADGVMHQTQNLENVGEGCELNHVAGAPRRQRIDVALSASYGFGGHDAVVVLRRGGL
jgi:3-oxoacyl-[acyl-carrier-protein] synthase II